MQQYEDTEGVILRKPSASHCKIFFRFFFRHGFNLAESSQVQLVEKRGGGAEVQVSAAGAEVQVSAADAEVQVSAAASCVCMYHVSVFTREVPRVPRTASCDTGLVTSCNTGFFFLVSVFTREVSRVPRTASCDTSLV